MTYQSWLVYTSEKIKGHVQRPKRYLAKDDYTIDHVLSKQTMILSTDPDDTNIQSMI